MARWNVRRLEQLDAVLERVSFNNWKFLTYTVNSEAVYLQIAANETCNVTGAPIEWKSRKWLLSPHMTDGEIVQTAFKAVMTAMEHEAREQFKYRGVTIFDPHYDVEKLVELRSRPDALKEREAA